MRKLYTLFISVFLLAFVSCNDELQDPSIIDELGVKGGKVLSFKAHLTGDQEVPAVETNATGQTIFKLSKDGSELSYKLIVANISDVFMAHIHYAEAGENGAVVTWLYPVGGPPTSLIPGKFNGVLAEGTITADDLVGPLAGMSLGKLVEGMVAGNTYVNVHTLSVPSGEIRGQISANNSKAGL